MTKLQKVSEQSAGNSHSSSPSLRPEKFSVQLMWPPAASLLGHPGARLQGSCFMQTKRPCDQKATTSHWCQHLTDFQYLCGRHPSCHATNQPICAPLRGDCNWISLPRGAWGVTSAKLPWVLTYTCNTQLQQQRKVSLMLET